MKIKALVKHLVVAATLVMSPAIASAQGVWITPDTPFVEYESNGKFFVIERNQDTTAVIDNSFARTSRECPPFCIQPFEIDPDVRTIAELELMEFLQTEVNNGTGILVDSRLTNWYDAGTIPGSVNIPFNLFTPSSTNPFLDAILTNLGGILRSNGTWDFSNVKTMGMFCNGPWCGQSPAAIRNLLDLGYPPEKILYYRGGMQMWLMLGLNVDIPEFG